MTPESMFMMFMHVNYCINKHITLLNQISLVLTHHSQAFNITLK